MTLHIPYLAALRTYISYGFLFLFGHIRDTFRSLLPQLKDTLKGYAPLCRDFEDFYTRRFYYRLQLPHHPLVSYPCQLPHPHITDGPWTACVMWHGGRCVGMAGGRRKDTVVRSLNLGSYNYLGFGAPDPYCTPRAQDSLHLFGSSTCSSRTDAGTTRVHVELERCVAEFIGKPAALVYGMGFATNSLTLPALVGKGSLIISDSLNHCSIIAGARASGAGIKVFQHNGTLHRSALLLHLPTPLCPPSPVRLFSPSAAITHCPFGLLVLNACLLDLPENLEQVLRTAIAEGQPRTHRLWKKVLIVVEGIYSMEGEICRLHEIMDIKRKYKAYLFLDEAHSIGALGRTGRGVCEVAGVDPADVDVLMGTFTKSFGSAGGYIAASHVRPTPCSLLPCSLLPCSPLPCSPTLCSPAPHSPAHLLSAPLLPTPLLTYSLLPCSPLPCSPTLCSPAPHSPAHLLSAPLFPTPLLPTPLLTCSLLPCSPLPCSPTLYSPAPLLASSLTSANLLTDFLHSAPCYLLPCLLPVSSLLAIARIPLPAHCTTFFHTSISSPSLHSTFPPSPSDPPPVRASPGADSVSEGHESGASVRDGHGASSGGADPLRAQAAAGPRRLLKSRVVAGILTTITALLLHLCFPSMPNAPTPCAPPHVPPLPFHALCPCVRAGRGGAGQEKLAQLRENCNWFRGELQRLGLEVLGDEDSPVMPIMIYHPGKIAAFSRECLKRHVSALTPLPPAAATHCCHFTFGRKKVAVVVVGFPATPVLLGRARICISAAHTRADLEYALKVRVCPQGASAPSRCECALKVRVRPQGASTPSRCEYALKVRVRPQGASAPSRCEYFLKVLDEVADLVGLKYIPPLPPLEASPHSSPTNGPISPGMPDGHAKVHGGVLAHGKVE
ncbi:unnamed protein product [Closterium sp. Naga37s-1]|nr:unnamed protein product [Closterium sp. Naga37s-1]